MNKNILLRILHIVSLMALLSLPSIAFALDLGLDPVRATGLPDWNISSSSGSNTIVLLITKVIKILLGVAGAIAVLFIIIGGFQYLTSGANPKGASAGKETVKNAVIGLIIIILSYVIVAVVASFVSTSPSGIGGSGGGIGNTGGGGGVIIH
jgi:hypothetical protein